jgi:hypothetical protein
VSNAGYGLGLSIFVAGVVLVRFSGLGSFLASSSLAYAMSRGASGVDERPVAEAADADALDDEFDVDRCRDRNLDEQVADVDLEMGEIPM